MAVGQYRTARCCKGFPVHRWNHELTGFLLSPLLLSRSVVGKILSTNLHTRSLPFRWIVPKAALYRGVVQVIDGLGDPFPHAVSTLTLMCCSLLPAASIQPRLFNSLNTVLTPGEGSRPGFGVCDPGQGKIQGWTLRRVLRTTCVPQNFVGWERLMIIV